MFFLSSTVNREEDEVKDIMQRFTNRDTVPTGNTLGYTLKTDIGYEPADLTVHPPPQNYRGWVHFFRIGV